MLAAFGSSRHSWILGYGVAISSMAVVAVSLWFMEGVAPGAMLILAVIVSAWFGGTRPGLFAIALSVPVLLYFLPPADSWAIHAEEVPRFLLPVVISLFIVWLIGSERRTAESLRDARDELERRNEALRIQNLEGKALEDVLRRNASQLRLVIDTIPAMAWSIHPDGRLEFLNQRWLEYAGLSLEEAIAQPTRAMHPDDIPPAIAKWQKFMVSGESYDGELRLRRADGEYRWFLVRTVPLYDENGRIVRWYGTSTDIEDRKRAEQDRQRVEQALRESAERLQHLSRRLLEVQEEERRHLARELHDEFGQLLASAKLRLHAAKTTAGSAAQANLEESIALLQRAGEQVRSLVLELRPTILETAGLDGTLRWLARQHEQQTGVATQVVGQLSDVSADLATACFRVAQEALTNVVRHAQAQHVWIELSQNDASLELVVRDDGAGFDTAKILKHAVGRGHLGLLGMRERVQILGGDLQIDSASGRGTRVRASFPLATALARPPEALA